MIILNTQQYSKQIFSIIQYLQYFVFQIQVC